LSHLPSIPNQHQNTSASTVTSDTSDTLAAQSTNTPSTAPSNPSNPLQEQAAQTGSTATSRTSVTQETETASEARKRKAVSVLQSGTQPPAVRINLPTIPVPEGYVFLSEYTKEQVDANPDLPYYVVNVCADGKTEENKRSVAAIKFQPPGLAMPPAQARQFPLLQRITLVSMSWARNFQLQGADQYIYE